MENQQKNIILGYLNHHTIGRQNTFIPLGIGLIAAYSHSCFNDKINIQLFDDPEVIFKEITRIKPDVIGLTNYCWNSELNRLVFQKAKEVNPSVVCVAGGPEFPRDETECKKYLTDRREIDFFCFAEGEVAFANLLEKILNNISLDELKSTPFDNMMSINPATGELVAGKCQPITDLNIIPSPYLLGLMDKWFTGDYAPSVQTTRGCPYKCAYCWTGAYQQEIKTYDIDRVKKELEYISVRMQKYPFALLSIVDSNFGMYERDEEIAVFLRELWNKYNWPNTFDVTMGKTNYDRIMRVSDILNKRINITCSLQSTNPKTLEIVKRKNLTPEAFIDLQNEIKKRGMWPVTELIVPMPCETKESFIEGMKFVIDNDVELIPFTLMLLKATSVASQEFRQKYQMVTRYRLLPRQFGEYNDEKCFETEEVCVGTNTMSHEEYCEIRGLCFIMSLYSHKQYDVFFRILKETNNSMSASILFIWDLIKQGNTPLSKLYFDYLDEVKSELWATPEEIKNYYSVEENYQKLLSGEMGDNLMRKYRSKALIEKFPESVRLAFDVIPALQKESLSHEKTEAIQAAEKWLIAMRNIGTLLDNPGNWQSIEYQNLPYDVNMWYESGSDAKKLWSYNYPVKYSIAYDHTRLETIYKQVSKIWSSDKTFLIGKMLNNYPVIDLWRLCKRS